MLHFFLFSFDEETKLLRFRSSAFSDGVALFNDDPTFEEVHSFDFGNSELTKKDLVSMLARMHRDNISFIQEESYL